MIFESEERIWVISWELSWSVVLMYQRVAGSFAIPLQDALRQSSSLKKNPLGISFWLVLKPSATKRPNHLVALSTKTRKISNSTISDCPTSQVVHLSFVFKIKLILPVYFLTRWEIAYYNCGRKHSYNASTEFQHAQHLINFTLFGK